MEEYSGNKLLKKVTYEYDEDYAIVVNHTFVDGTEYIDRTEYYKNDEGKNKYDKIKKAVDGKTVFGLKLKDKDITLSDFLGDLCRKKWLIYCIKKAMEKTKVTLQKV